MEIETDEDLERALQEAGGLMQQIQDYIGRDFSKPAKLRFPRGYIRTATEARKRLGFLDNKNLRSNIAYTMMLSDVQHWLLVRTDLAGTAKEMVIKLQIFLLGSIVESITKSYLKGKCGKNYCGRTKYLEENGIITEALRQDLDWLWGLRNKMHLFQLDQTEWLSTDYSLVNHNRAVQAFKKLIQTLNDDN
jgi:hypothetical protein